MQRIHHGFTLTLTALAAALALAACDRGDRSETARNDTGATSSGSTTYGSKSSPGAARTSPSTGTARTDSSATGSMSGAGTSAAPGTTPSATGAATATSALPAPDAQFVTKAAEGGQFEVEIAKMAAAKATDPQVKSFAQMLLDDHTAANDKLRQIASSHNVALPASLPDDKKKELDQLGRLSGADFDRGFVDKVGLKDHQHDIDEFEKAAKSAKSDDVRNYAQSTLPTLKKHLAAAEKLPHAAKTKG